MTTKNCGVLVLGQWALSIILASGWLLISGCPNSDSGGANGSSTASGGANANGQVDTNEAAGEPKLITVQHLLIGFEGSVPGKPITRTKEEAEALAKELLAEAQKPDANFGQMVSKQTDDSYPGIYMMANNEVKVNEMPAGYTPRKRLVAAFGDVGFKLKLNEVGLAPYDTARSPYGWHIIKRIE